MAEFIYAGDAGAFKTCTRCKALKPLVAFSTLAIVLVGRRPACKECASRESRDYHAANRDRINQKNREQYHLDPEIHRLRARSWHEDNRLESNARAKLWKLNNKERVTDYNKNYYADNIDDSKGRYAEWADINRVHRRKYMAEWYGLNPHKHSEYGARRREDVRFKIESAIRCRIWSGIKRGSKFGRRTFDLLGYTVEELRAHLERKFQPGMSWENYGDWHIDHIRPLSSFSYETPNGEDFRAAWSLSNLQPLWARDNLIKGARWAPGNLDEADEPHE